MPEISRKAHVRFVGVSRVASRLALQEGPMKRCGWVVMIALMLLAPLAAQSLEVELQRAIQRETATGDVQKAPAEARLLCERATRPPRERAVAAKALLRIAECYQMQGELEARRWYEQL